MIISLLDTKLLFVCLTEIGTKNLSSKVFRILNRAAKTTAAANDAASNDTAVNKSVRRLSMRKN